MKMPNGDVFEFLYSDSIAQIICIDESDHPLSTKTDRGGHRSISYDSNDDNRQGRRGTRGSHHTTGVYTINENGEVLPPTIHF